MNCGLKDAQDESDLSVNEHPLVGDPEIQQHEVSSNDNEISRENESDRSTILPSDDQIHELEAEDVNPTLTGSTWHAALVLGRAGKATGKNKYWINIKNLCDNTLQSLNLEELTSWKNMDEEVFLTPLHLMQLKFCQQKRKSWTIGKDTMFILKFQTKGNNVFLLGG